MNILTLFRDKWILMFDIYLQQQVVFHKVKLTLELLSGLASGCKFFSYSLLYCLEGSHQCVKNSKYFQKVNYLTKLKKKKPPITLCSTFSVIKISLQLHNKVVNICYLFPGQFISLQPNEKTII